MAIGTFNITIFPEEKIQVTVETHADSHPWTTIVIGAYNSDSTTIRLPAATVQEARSRAKELIVALGLADQEDELEQAITKPEIMDDTNHEADTHAETERSGGKPGWGVCQEKEEAT